ncbi:MAG TPA: zinc ribbon domain-containing protein, partial [Candidatus Wallbacteria bacterium]|nr:zinc ribbon domain-containing protein [Candidatus Wallbacteria bacterium]
MNCHKCGTDIPGSSGWDFCPECGINLYGKCFSCGHISHVASKFCVKCGKAVSHNALAVKLNESVSLVIRPQENDAVISAPNGTGKTVMAHSEISEVPQISKEKEEDDELDSNSFNVSETPDFLKKLGHKETAGD